MYKLGVIHNPKAKRNKGTDEFNENVLEGILRQRNASGFVIKTENTDSDLHKAVETCKKEKVDIICINGGDGTDMHTSTKIMEIYSENHPAILPMRGGTMNNFAWCSGIRGKNPAQILERMVQLSDGIVEFRKQNLVHAHDIETGKHYYGTAFAAGPAVKAFFDDYYSIEVPGMRDVSRIMGKLISSGEYREKYKGVLTADVMLNDLEMEEKRFTVLAASSLPRVADFLHVFPYVLGQEKKMHFVALSEGLPRAVRNALRVGLCGVLDYCSEIGMPHGFAMLSRLIRPNGNGFYDCCADRAGIDSGSITYIMDGEPMPEARRLEITSDTEVRVPRIYG